MRDFIAIELKPYQGAILERADEQRSLPSGKARRVVEGHARYRRRHLPVMDGLLRAVDVGALCFGSGKSAVIDAMGSQWPAVVLAGLRNIDRIAAAWTMLVRTEIARQWIQRRPVLMAMAVRPGLRAYLRIADQRVFVGNAGAGGRA